MREILPGSRVGPYRIQNSIGSGGMGQVFRALDSRLGREVAIKVVHPNAAPGSAARERLRREARAAAALSHPAIVQVYDIVEHPEGDCIVMEFIDGRSLAEMLADGPLPVAELLDLASDVAAGLQRAHSRGIIHRDLKPENVMVTAEGKAKLLDFGLAKHLLTGGIPASTQLTREGHLVGTFHGMSPEQAQGLRVDARSDLFSFGALLYHCATAHHPFLGRTATETLTRVCVRRQPSARSLNPEVPSELSQLIDHLLEKQPVHRPQSAEAVVETLRHLSSEIISPSDTHRALGPVASEDPIRDAPTISAVSPRVLSGDESSSSRSLFPLRPPAWPVGVAAGGVVTVLFLVLLRPQFPSLLDEPKLKSYVAIAEPTFGPGGSADETLLAAAGVRDGLTRGLVSLDGAVPVLSRRGDPIPSTALDLARAVAANEVVTTRLDCIERGCRIELSRVDANDGRVLAFEGFEAPSDDLPLLTTTVQRHLASLYPELSADERLPRLEIEAKDYEQYLTIHQTFLVGESGVDLDDLLERLARIRESSPRFFEALVLEARVAHVRFLESRDSRDVDHAVALVERARTLAPKETRPLFTLFAVAFDSGRLDLAQEAQSRLAELAPGHPRLEIQQSWLDERLGESELALERMRRAVSRRPAWNNLFSLAQMEIRQGRAAPAREHLRQALERSPDNLKCQSLLAQLELLNGDPWTAVELYSMLVSRAPGVQELSNLGVAQLLVGDYESAAETFRQLLGEEPNNPSIVLNLADALDLQGEFTAAREHYLRVIELVQSDPGPSPYLLTARAQALAHLGRKVEAVTALREALRRRPDDPQILQEAALVYTLVGDHVSAEAHIEAALERGVQARWFRFPWFEKTLGGKELDRLLATSDQPSVP